MQAADPMGIFQPQRIYVSPEAAGDPMTLRVLARLRRETSAGSVEKGEFAVNGADAGDPLAGNHLSPADEISRYSQGKSSLLLGHYRGAWLKRCPGTNRHVCCNLWVLNPGEGCPMDCTYCSLQSYLRRNPTIKLFTNTSAMTEAVLTRVRAEPSRYFRICTGELMDSLALDPLTDLTLDLVPLFAGLENACLELKTKSACVSNLLLLKSEHKGRTVVSWSLNAAEVVEREERGAPGLYARLDAARAVMECGYRIGLHFDPLIAYPGWEEGYREAVRAVFSRIEPQRIAWISLATLRYPAVMQEIMLRRFPESKLPLGEHFFAKDGKYRYFQPLRLRLLRFVYRELKAVSPSLPVYLCMESRASWRSIVGSAPAFTPGLSEVYSRRGQHNEVSRCACVM